MTARQLFTAIFFFLPLSIPGRAFNIQNVSSAGGSATVCYADPAVDHLSLFLNDAAGHRLETFDAAARFVASKGERLAFAMNAGMFMVDRAPLGLFVADGRKYAALNLHSATGNFYWKPNGVFALTGSSAVIVPSPDYPAITRHITLATQSGPLLLVDGKLHPGFDPGSPSRLIRNGVGIISLHKIVFVIGETPMNFYEFATFFRDQLHCRDALFFDGNVSSLYLPEKGRNDQITPLGPMIGIVQSAK